MTLNSWHRWMRTTSVVAGILAAASGLVACGGSPTPEPAGASGSGAAGPSDTPGLSLVVGAHANAPRPELGATLQELLQTTAREQGYVSVVTAAGQPTQLDSGQITLDCNNGPACEQMIRQRVGAVDGAVQSARAGSAENDLLRAIDLAAAPLRDRAGSKTLAVLDSGLPTVGALRMQEPGVLDAVPGDVAALLASQKELPDLRGFTVVFTGLGQVNAPQAPLRLSQQRNLAAMWTAIARAAGATDVRVLSDPQTTPAAPGLPPVTPVEVPASFDPGCLGSLRESEVAFVPNSARLADPAAADQVLGPLADCLRQLARPVTLTGTTSSAGDPKSSQTLSARRADTIKNELERRQVPGSLITTRGVGYQIPPCVNDRDGSGRLLPGPAALNRQVVITPAAP